VNRARWLDKLPGTARRGTPPAGNGAQEWLSLHEALAHAPALIAVTWGPRHILAYVNDAYRRVFGPRALDVPAQQSLPELVEHGLLGVLDEVYRTGRACSVRARRVEYSTVDYPGVPYAERRFGFFTFVCTPIRHESGPVRGVLVFGHDVTDQVQATERLRESERRHRQAAVTLQRSLLPQRLEQPDELHVAVKYLPGGADAAVGGDWYDVIPLGAGRTAFVIGDVMGRGVRAAAVMGQLRTAVRAYARLDLPPHEVLRLLDGLATEIDATHLATCVYAVYDPYEGVLTHSAAGHLPLLARWPDGTVRQVEGEGGPPLGTGGGTGVPYHSGALSLPPGSCVVFYTDGLVERRGQDIDEGIEELTRALASVSGSAPVVCDRLIRDMQLPDGHDDDVALLVLQVPQWNGQRASLFRVASLDLLGGNEIASRARAFTTGVLASWQLPEEIRDSGVLAVSEFVANALTHGSPPVRLRLRRTDRRLIMEVCDGDDHMPRRRRADVTDEDGRGIAIVATIASAWGSRPAPSGKIVWCEFLLPK
jgi:serine phosphatase RsbU (regulator of sigma subunit)/anti-sigma regulatory factor (Ser/Thr protein kinase)